MAVSVYAYSVFVIFTNTKVLMYSVLLVAEHRQDSTELACVNAILYICSATVLLELPTQASARVVLQCDSKVRTL